MKPILHDYITLYHGTTAQAAEGIRESGFLPNATAPFVMKEGYTPTSGYCYFSTERKFALNLARWRAACENDCVPPHLHRIMPTAPRAAARQVPVVLRIRLSPDVFSRFEPDPDCGRSSSKQWRVRGTLSPGDFVLERCEQVPEWFSRAAPKT